ncbi:MAG: hypothetical protein ABH827_05545 [bacterium]
MKNIKKWFSLFLVLGFAFVSQLSAMQKPVLVSNVLLEEENRELSRLSSEIESLKKENETQAQMLDDAKFVLEENSQLTAKLKSLEGFIGGDAKKENEKIEIVGNQAALKEVRSELSLVLEETNKYIDDLLGEKAEITERAVTLMNENEFLKNQQVAEKQVNKPQAKRIVRYIPSVLVGMVAFLLGNSVYSFSGLDKNIVRVQNQTWSNFGLVLVPFLAAMYLTYHLLPYETKKVLRRHGFAVFFTVIGIVAFNAFFACTLKK